MKSFVPQSTRLFPPNGRLEDIRITGIAARCDWVVLSLPRQAECLLVRHASDNAPRHVFVSLRNLPQALRFFHNVALPQITAPFVLVTGSEDVTLPHQTDVRFPPLSDVERRMLNAVLNHPLLIHWFAENLDDASDPRMSPLPLGIVDHLGQLNQIDVPICSSLASRPTRALCHNVLREGPQWHLRDDVNEMARTHWHDFCTLRTDQVLLSEYYEEVERHAFVLCVRGGGLDPSEKAWRTLLQGAVPIIASNALDAAYRQLPVIVIPKWSPDALTASRLAAWKDRLQPQFDDPELRAQVLNRLGLDYWWSGVVHRART